MTHQANPRNALEAVLAAGRAAASSHEAAQVPNALQERQLAAIDHAALILLARVLAHRPAQGPPIVQIAGCTQGEASASIACTLAHACAAVVGRTLLVQIEPPWTGLFPSAPPAAPLPDMLLPGLYHHRLGAGAADFDMMYGPLRDQTMAMLVNPFRIAIVQAPGPFVGASLALAPLCHSTVLVVEAGRTPIAAIREAVQAYTGVGGHVIGTVLAGCRADHPPVVNY